MSKENSRRAYAQYNAIMLARILTDNPAERFTQNFDAKFISTTKGLLRDGQDMSVQQILRETLDYFEEQKLPENPTLGPLIEMWKKEKNRYASSGTGVSVIANSNLCSDLILLAESSRSACPAAAAAAAAATTTELLQPPPAKSNPYGVASCRRACCEDRGSKNHLPIARPDPPVDSCFRTSRQRIGEGVRRSSCSRKSKCTNLHQL